MEAKVLKWGNSLAFWIPKAIAKECGLVESTLADIPLTGGEIVIRPLKKKYVLSELLDGMNSQNIHGEVRHDEPAGQELL